MSVQELIDQLGEIENKDLPVYAVHSASGSSHELSSIFPNIKGEGDCAGPLCVLEDGTPYLCITVSG